MIVTTKDTIENEHINERDEIDECGSEVDVRSTKEPSVAHGQHQRAYAIDAYKCGGVDNAHEREREQHAEPEIERFGGNAPICELKFAGTSLPRRLSYPIRHERNECECQ